jgi:hypothetical protein
MNIYEYLFAGLILVLVLTASIVMVATISTPANNASDKNELSITAQKVMTQMMLDSGYPNTWGSTSASPQVFGLAKCGEISRQAYELDPDKVMRLNSLNPDYMQPKLAVELLNLENSYGAADYGFTLQFNDSIHISSPAALGPAYADNYTVTVTSEYALPINGVEVSATLYYINNQTTPSTISHSATLHGVTVYDGSYNANFNSKTVTAKILALTVDYYGVQVTKFYQLTTGPQATLYQNKLLANSSQPYDVRSDADARQIILTCNNGAYGTNDLAVKNSGTPSSFTVSGSLEPSAVAVLAISGAAHDQLVLASRDYSHISYQTSNFQNSAVPAGIFSYSLERTVLIGGSVYTATFYIWRMSS